jgi:hypothetical protein
VWIAHVHSGLQEKQLATCHLFHYFQFGTWKGTEQIGYRDFKLFSSYFWLIPLGLFIITESKKLYILQGRLKFVPCCVISYAGFPSFSFSRSFGASQTKKMAVLLSMNHHVAQRLDRCTIHRTVYSVTDCQYFTNSSGCYLNVNYFTPICIFAVVFLLLILLSFVLNLSTMYSNSVMCLW